MQGENLQYYTPSELSVFKINRGAVTVDIFITNSSERLEYNRKVQSNAIHSISEFKTITYSVIKHDLNVVKLRKSG